ncbi:MAG: PAS domain S-box protein [Gammaproteobacteria bacterium]|nr:PAS domain S-box protein [Gammaproteobacteria bacterium]MCF6337214.1 PAS domain S-box protein [Gammaproteobacteria bacterium]
MNVKSQIKDHLDTDLSRLIQEYAVDGIISIDTQGLIHSFNPAAEKMFGYHVDEVMGQNINRLMPEANSKQHDGYLQHYLQSGQGSIIGIAPREVVALRRDGSTFPMELAISEMRQPNGQVLFIGILRDITRRKESEAEIKYLAQFVTSNPGVVLKVSTDYKILFGNPASLALLKKLQLKQGDQAPETWRDTIDAVFEHRQLQQLEVVIDDKASLLTIPYIDDTSVNIYGIDITQRRQAEQELRVSEERFSLITRGTRDGIWDWDLTTDQIYFSPRWKTMLNYQEDELANNFSTLQTLIHPDDLGVALDNWTTCMEGETDDFTVEYRLKNKHGSYTWILCRGTTLHNDNGNPVRITGSHTDISGQKQALAVMEHMQRETQAKAEDLEEVMTDDTRKQMGLLRGRVQRLEGLINGILQYSRVGRVDMETEMVDTTLLLAEVLDGLAPPPGLHIDVTLDMPCLVTAPLPLSQVFGNLLSNAIKYHDRPEDGHITISARNLKDGGYEFSVADDGPGIAPEFHDKVFQIFQTLNARDKVESTGIGLTVVKKIVEQLGGDIMLESAEGEGSIFRFTLPEDCDRDEDEDENEEHIANNPKTSNGKH